MSDTIAAPPGWYYCRVREGDMHFVRYPIAAWRVATGEPVAPLLAKPGEPGLVPPTAEDRAALVGLLPPDREWASYFASEDVQDAARRLFAFQHPRRAEEGRQSTVREVQMPGVGPIPVRDARPNPGEAQRGTADWLKRAWGDAGAGPQRLPSGSE